MSMHTSSGTTSTDLSSEMGNMSIAQRVRNNSGGSRASGSSGHSGGSGGSRGGAARRFGNGGNQRGTMTSNLAPIAKADMPYRGQTFCSRPEKRLDTTTLCKEKATLVSNYFRLKAPNVIKVYQYDLSYKNQKNMDMIKREDTRVIFWNIVEKHGNIFPTPTKMLFNDINLLFTLEQLNLGRQAGEITLSTELGRKVYKMRCVYTGYVDVDTQSTEPDKRHLMTQFLDAVITQRVKSLSADGQYFTTFGHSIFYSPLSHGGEQGYSLDLGSGMQALTGLHGAVKPDCEGGLLYNVDISHSVFYKQRVNLIEFACEILMNGKFEPGKPDDHWRKLLSMNCTDRGFRKETRAKLEACFKGMKFSTTYNKNPATAGREYKFIAITGRAASAEMFKDEASGRRISVEEYFYNAYQIRLTFPFLPCLQIHKKTMMVPMELLMTSITPIRFKGQVHEKVLANMIRGTAYSPEERFGKIQEMCRENKENRVPSHLAEKDMYMRTYDVSLDKTFQTVKASVLPVPKLQFGNNQSWADTKHEGQWKLTAKSQRGVDFRPAVDFMKKKIIVSLFVCDPNQGQREPINFMQYNTLMKTLYNFGVDVHLDCQSRPINELHYLINKDTGMAAVAKFKSDMEAFKEHAKTKYPDCTPLGLVILPFRSTTRRVRKADGVDEAFSQYGMIKYVCDVMVGINCQCILKQVYDKISGGLECSTAHNVSLKIMAKLGVKHYDLERDGEHRNWTKLTNPEEPTLILGVDVTHPGVADRKQGDHAALSVASIVGNVDIECLQYDTSVRVQRPGEERTVHMRDEIKRRIVAFTDKNKIRPAHIVVYRDGVSETEFQRTLYEEKASIEGACLDLDPEYKPTISYIVVTKRHHTRFALGRNPEDPSNLKGATNVKPGTLVESHITSNTYFDFFLVSHFGALGTSRPTHYYVLYDTWNPSYAFWQTITHALTYAYVRCPKSISQPAPVMYAHLAAKRAKDYLNAYTTGNNINLQAVTDYEHYTRLNQNLQRNEELKGMIFL